MPSRQAQDGIFSSQVTSGEPYGSTTQWPSTLTAHHHCEFREIRLRPDRLRCCTYGCHKIRGVVWSRAIS